MQSGASRPMERVLQESCCRWLHVVRPWCQSPMPSSCSARGRKKGYTRSHGGRSLGEEARVSISSSQALRDSRQMLREGCWWSRVRLMLPHQPLLGRTGSRRLASAGKAIVVSIVAQSFDVSLLRAPSSRVPTVWVNLERLHFKLAETGSSCVHLLA